MAFPGRTTILKNTDLNMSSSKDIAIDIIPLEESSRNHISRRPAFARDDSPSGPVRYEPFRRRGAYAELSGEERGNGDSAEGGDRYVMFLS